MAAARCILNEEQFLCPICLDLFCAPVSTPCGHNFCKACLTQNWDYSAPCCCPVCKRSFKSKPELHVNTFINEMVSQFKNEAERRVSEPKEETTHENELLIEERHEKIREIQHLLDTCKVEARRTEMTSVDVLAEIRGYVQQQLDTVIERIQDAQKRSEKEAEDTIKQLQEEIGDLQEEPQHTPRSLVEVRYDFPIFEQILTSTVVSLQKTLDEKVLFLRKAELNVIRQYAVDVDFDPDTAHPFLELSENLKEARFTGQKRDVPDLPQRFTVNPCVLGNLGYSSGRFYFEVQVKGKTEWDLGVARESVVRKRDIPLCPDDGYWCVWLRNRSKFRALENVIVRLSPRCAPERVGVSVDYDGGVVSFYDADWADLIYSFSGCRFMKEKIVPYFGPGLNATGRNSAPLVITSVTQNTEPIPQS